MFLINKLIKEIKIYFTYDSFVEFQLEYNLKKFIIKNWKIVKILRIQIIRTTYNIK